MTQLTPYQALVHVMVTMAAADTNMTDKELLKIETIIQYLPIFADYDRDQLAADAAECQLILENENGLATIIENLRNTLDENMYETAYALAVEVAAADLFVEQEELLLLQMIRQDLGIDKIISAAIERGARARHRTL